MFDPLSATMTRVWLCGLADIPIDTYKYLLKNELWPFASDYGDGSGWARYSPIHVCVARTMRKLVDKESFGLSWALAAHIAHGGASGFYCVLKDRYGELADAESAKLLAAPWTDRSKDLWTGYARISPANAFDDEDGWTLPCGTYASLAKVIEAPPGDDAVDMIHQVNLSQIVRGLETRGRSLKIKFPFDQSLVE
jgi:hypothetical protein